MRLSLFWLPVILAAQSPPSNLGLQTGTPGEPPPGWSVPQSLKTLGYRAEYRKDGCFAAAGCAVLLPPTTMPPDSFGMLGQLFDATPFRGKTVRLRALVKVDPVQPAGHAQLWLRVERAKQQMGFYDDMGDRPITSPQWRSYEITGEVAADAESIEIGLKSYGKGAVWMEGLTFEVMPDATAGSDVIAVRSQLQKLYERIDLAYAQKDLDAVAALALPDAQIHLGPNNNISLYSALLQIMTEMEKGAKYASKSTVTNLRLSGADAVASVSNEATRTLAGTKQVVLSANRDTWVKTGTGWRLKESSLISTRSVAPPMDALSGAAVVAELKQRAIPLKTAEPGGPHDDLVSFGNAIGEAKIVSLGEASNGTREFFQLKHRLLEYLVSEKGFTVFAVEANWPESLAVDRYIKTGEGSAKAALGSLYLWQWNTAEMVDLIEWMRNYNRTPGQHPVLTFTSFDMQVAHVAARMVLDYLGKYAPDAVATAGETYAEAQMLENRRVQFFDEQAKSIAERAAAVIRLFDFKRAEFTESSSAAAWRDARQAAVVVFQSCTIRIPGKGPGYRDASMAENVDWLRLAHTDEKVVLWAHNTRLQLGLRPNNEKTMGSELRELHGKEMYVVGFAFRRGSVRAVGTGEKKLLDLSVYNVPASAEGSGDATLSEAGMPLFFLDMAAIPAGTQLARWLAEPHLFHNFGASWTVDHGDANMELETLSTWYDGLMFVEESHATQALPN